MLKSIVVVLALANAGYFLWTRGIAHPPEAGPEAPTTTLKLTSEVPASQRGPPLPAADEDSGAPAGAAGIVGATPGAGSAASCWSTKRDAIPLSALFSSAVLPCNIWSNCWGS